MYYSRMFIQTMNMLIKISKSIFLVYSYHWVKYTDFWKIVKDVSKSLRCDYFVGSKSALWYFNNGINPGDSKCTQLYTALTIAVNNSSLRNMC